MIMTASSPPSAEPQALFAWRRVRVVLIVSLVLSVLWLPIWQAWWVTLVARLVLIGLAQVMVFGLFERWPSRLPRWLARWVLQLAAVALVVPFAVALAYTLTTFADITPWYQDKARSEGFFGMSVVGILVSPRMMRSSSLKRSDLQQRRASATSALSSKCCTACAATCRNSW